MTAREAVRDAFLWIGVALVLASCLGVLAFPSVYDRLHFSSPATLGAICIAIAVVFQEDFSLVGDKAILIAVFLLGASPLLAHATARASRRAERGDWRIGADEETEVEDE